MQATYSPEDNKLRLYPVTRLDTETYTRVKAAGFSWAPKQELFVAPMWTPEREDLLLSLCDEIGDEDTSLVERAEQRAERFEDYSESRAQDAHSARKAVSAIADNIPLGQPILVGHHSEKRARKDAERIENGMRRAVKMWETSKYWESRAAGAIHAAKYKERPDVRARRIKKLESEKRGQERHKANAERALRFWRGDFKLTNKETGEKIPFEITEANRERILRFVGGVDGEVGRFNVVKGAQSWEGWTPWHVLQPDGERYASCPSCTVEQCREAAERVFTDSLVRHNRWIAHYENRLTYERAMLAADGGTVADQTGPQVGGACRCWASPGYGRGWSFIQKVNKVSVTLLDTFSTDDRAFTRTIPFDKLHAIMTKAQVDEARAGGFINGETKLGFYLLDSAPEPRPETKPAKEPNEFDAMKDSLKAGIQVVSAPQLFPTPPDLAKRLVELADIKANQRILEPSAGTGALLRAILSVDPEPEPPYLGRVLAIEINNDLAERLGKEFPLTAVQRADFLECNGALGQFDRIVMNPPFQNGADIKHIEHALTFLKPGGRLVAICANGPRQQEKLMPMATMWKALPAGSFSESGTEVNAAILVIDG